MTIAHEVRNGFCTQCGDTEEWLRSQGQTVVEAPAPAEGLAVSGVRHDAAHSLRVDRTAAPGERIARTFWCSCGAEFGKSYDSPAIAAYRAHRKG